MDKITGKVLCPPVLSTLILSPLSLPPTTSNLELSTLQEGAQSGKDLVSFIPHDSSHASAWDLSTKTYLLLFNKTA